MLQFGACGFGNGFFHLLREQPDSQVARDNFHEKLKCQRYVTTQDGAEKVYLVLRAPRFCKAVRKGARPRQDSEARFPSGVEKKRDGLTRVADISITDTPGFRVDACSEQRGFAQRCTADRKLAVF